MKSIMFFFAAFAAFVAASPAPAHAWGSFGGFASESSRPTEKSDGTFAQGEALRQGTFTAGEVVFARRVDLEGRYGETTGKVAGAAIGVLAGSKVGKGNGQIVGGILGGLIGASLGGTAGRAVSTDTATELFLRLDNGRQITVVQVMDREVRPGDKVFVTQSSGNNWRVVQPAAMY